MKNFTIKIFFYLTLFIFFFYSFADVLLHLFYENKSGILYGYYTDTYGVIALIGGVLGLLISRLWGGFRSVVGRAIIMLSFGVLFQFLGQVSYAWYRFAYNIEAPYPAFGELFYMSSIPIYIYGIWQIAVASGVKYKLKDPKYRLISISAILSVVVFSYWLFLSKYDFSNADPIIILIEFWYPIGQALYITLAGLTLLLSKNLLGGQMRNKVYFVLFAFAVQYIADTYFTVEYNLDAFYPGGLSDYLYFISYFIMVLAIYRFSELPTKLEIDEVTNSKTNG